MTQNTNPIPTYTTPDHEAAYAAALLGKLGGSVKSERKARASRKNGKKGGRPKTAK